MNYYWDFINNESNQEYFKDIICEIDKEYSKCIVYPPKEQVFDAFRLTSFNNVKVVFIGQDPYHNEFQANGLAFSVSHNVSLPKSLINIYKELDSDLGIKRINGDLTSWAKQGCLMLNATLTVRKNEPTSHKYIKWERFTDNVIKHISDNKTGVIFVLWGNYAKKKLNLIDTTKHHIISSAHPSPLSAYRGFFDSKPFSKINSILDNPIDWS